MLGVDFLLPWFGKNPEEQGKEDSGVGDVCSPGGIKLVWPPEMIPENSCDPNQGCLREVQQMDEFSRRLVSEDLF